MEEEEIDLQWLLDNLVLSDFIIRDGQSSERYKEIVNGIDQIKVKLEEAMSYYLKQGETFYYVPLLTERRTYLKHTRKTYVDLYHKALEIERDQKLANKSGKKMKKFLKERERILDKEIELEKMRRENNQKDHDDLESLYEDIINNMKN